MSERGGRALVAPLARRRIKLEAKGKTRPHKKIARRLPAGSGDLASVPKGKDYVGGSKSGGVEEYCAAVRGATETFKESHRAESTAAEHDMYMRLINCWAERSGFGTYVVPREGADGKSPAVRAARDAKTGELRVIRPEMIVGMMLEMATGDPNMPKGGHADDLAMLASTDAKQMLGPRTSYKRKRGEFGFGPYSDEPWSLQAMEKRLYAMRDFYKRELKGTEIDNPGHDDLVEGTRAALVLLIGRKATHVPKVRTNTDTRQNTC